MKRRTWRRCSMVVIAVFGHAAVAFRCIEVVDVLDDGTSSSWSWNFGGILNIISHDVYLCCGNVPSQPSLFLATTGHMSTRQQAPNLFSDIDMLTLKRQATTKIITWFIPGVKNVSGGNYLLENATVRPQEQNSMRFRGGECKKMTRMVHACGLF